MPSSDEASRNCPDAGPARLGFLRTSLLIVARHWVYLLVYLGLLSVMGVFVTMGYAADGQRFHESGGRVAVVDRDGSELSRGLAAFLARFSTAGLGEDGGLTEVEDAREAIADLVAQDVVSYVLVVPEGFGAGFMAAAAAGTDAPTLETVVSYQSGSGVLMDLRTTQYLQAAYGYAGTISVGDQARTVRLAADAMAEHAAIEALPAEVEALPPRFVGYLGWCTYPLFASAAVLVSVLMRSLNRPDTRRRALAAPTSAASRTVQTYLACIALAIVSWAWVMGVGLVACGADLLVTSGPQVALMALALAAYALVSVSMGFLLGQIGIDEMMANAIGNVGGMVFSFLSGAWMPFEMLDEGVQAAARLTPGYWAAEAVNAARDMAATSWEAAAPSLGATGIVALFALACTLVAVALGSARSREAS